MAKSPEKPAAQSAAPAADAIDFGQYAGAGFETVSANDVGIPFLVILQKGSPEVDEDSDECIEGAKPGMFMNNVTKELFDGRETGVQFIPAAFRKYYVEWKPRESGGGGLVAMHEDEVVLRGTKPNDKGQSALPNGNIIIPTAYYFGTMLTASGPKVVILSFASTQLKKSRAWLYQMNNIKMKRADGTEFVPPMCSHIWRIKTVPESNDKGTWYGYKLEVESVVADAKVFKESLQLSSDVTKSTPRLAPPTNEPNTDIPV